MAQSPTSSNSPPVLLDFYVTPTNPTATDVVQMVIDFSEPTTLANEGVLANGQESISDLGYDVGAVTQGPVDASTYRWVIDLLPNDNLVEGDTINFKLPAANYISTVTNISGEISAETSLNSKYTPSTIEDNMMNHLMWHQGKVGQEFPNCGGCPEGTLPQSLRVAAEYSRGCYTLTNVLYPYVDPYNQSNMGIVRACLDKVKAGDTIWMVVVPPMHRVLDAGINSYQTLEPGSDLGSLAGMKARLSYATFKGESEGTEMGEIQYATSAITFPDAVATETGAIEDAKMMFETKIFANMVTPVGTWIGFGITVDSLPTNTDSLSEITAGLAVVVHALGFDAQIQMG